jgi:glycosyltransferase involved in cell wall biosynthesis
MDMAIGQPFSLELIVVDDASTDGSPGIAHRLADLGVRLVRHPYNLGQGAALQTGLDYVMRDPLMGRVVTFDADGQHRVEDAAAMVRLLGSGDDGAPDVVLGSRFVGGRGQMGRVKRLVLKLAVAYTNFSVGTKLTDTHNGLRAMTRRAAQQISLTQNGMAHATEFLEQMMAAKLTYVEHGVEITYSEYAKKKGQSLLNSVNILVDLLVR